MLRSALTLLLALAAPPAQAAFEPTANSARAAALGGALTAVGDDPASLFYNPATLGLLDRAAFSASYLRQFHSPAGEVDQDVYAAAAALPVKQDLINGTFGFSMIQNRQNFLGRERSFGLGFGSRSLWQSDDRHLDAGLAVKALKKTLDSGESAPAQPSVDAGLLYRWSERYAAGFSVLNANSPSVRAGGFRDRAPAELRVGVSESARGFTLALDAAKREASGHHPGSSELAAGFERWWATARAGSYAARTGLSLGDRNKTWSGGLGWRLFGGQLDYSLTVPMTGVTRLGHAVSIVLRFGQSNPESEYERVLATEIGYRKDVVAALESGEVMQFKLAEELVKLRGEIDLLREKLGHKTVSEAETKRRLKELEDRHREAMENFERMRGESRKLASKTQKTLFDEDWTAYLKLKLSGAPDAALTDQVNRLLRQYKDSGVDLSGANQELLRLLRSR